MKKRYGNNVSVAQDDLFRHPTAAWQEGTNFSELDKIPAIKVKVTLNHRYGNTRMTNLYLPPGEVVTFELISEDAAGKVSVQINQQKIQKGGAIGYRYPYQIGTTTLSKKINKW